MPNEEKPPEEVKPPETPPVSKKPVKEEVEDHDTASVIEKTVRSVMGELFEAHEKKVNARMDGFETKLSAQKGQEDNNGTPPKEPPALPEPKPTPEPKKPKFKLWRTI